jgi:fused signal recognition particle receptor
MADNIFSKWINGLDKTRKVTFGRISNMLGLSEIDSDTWDDLEALLVQADLGIETTELIIESLKEKVNTEGITLSEELFTFLKDDLHDRIDEPPNINFHDQKPYVITLVGVNGSGKTTSAAKLGNRFTTNGKKVLLAAADTYRAAAIEQLQSWGSRLNLPVISSQPGGDPGAVAFDAIQSAVAKKYDFLIIDTAGRLHTRYNLMEELKKVHKVANKALPGAPHATWLVLDATTGQNALHQARAFKEAVKVDGIILTKLDSSARGGMVFAIQKELGLPILFAGLGEKPEDLQPFDREAFIRGIFSE